MKPQELTALCHYAEGGVDILQIIQAVLEKVQEICGNYLRAGQLMLLARREVSKTLAEADNEKEINSLKAKTDNLNKQHISTPIPLHRRREEQSSPAVKPNPAAGFKPPGDMLGT